MKKTTMSALRLLPISLLVATAAQADVSYEVRAGAAWNDNVARQSVGAEESTVGLLGLRLDADHESRRLVSAVNMNLEQRFYSGSEADNELLGAAGANLLFRVRPEVLEWFARYGYGKVQSNPFAANRPGNREDVHNVSTGPRLRLPIGGATALQLDGEYRTTIYESTDFDNDMLRGQLSLIRALSATRSVSLNVTADRTEYDRDSGDIKFDRQTAYVGFDSEARRGNLSIGVGYNEVHDFGTTLDGVFIDVSVSRELSSRATFSVDFDRRLSDGGDIFSRFSPIDESFGDVRDITNEPGALELNRLTAALRFNGRAANYYVRAMGEDQDFEDTNNPDRERLEVSAGIDKDFGEAWRVGIDGRLRRYNFSGIDRTDDGVGAGFTITRQLTRTLGLRLRYSYEERESDDPNASFEENEVSLVFTWSSR